MTLHICLNPPCYANSVPILITVWFPTIFIWSFKLSSVIFLKLFLVLGTLLWTVKAERKQQFMWQWMNRHKDTQGTTFQDVKNGICIHLLKTIKLVKNCGKKA